MQTLGPYTLAATGAPFQVEWGGTAQPSIGIDLENISGLLLTVEVNGQNFWLLPWTAKYVPIPGNTTSLTVIPGSEVEANIADPLKLTAVLYQVGDTPPVIVERQLTGLATVAAIDGTVNVQGNINIVGSADIIVSQQSITMGVGNNNFPITIPSGISSIAIAITGASGGGGYGRTTNRYQITAGQQVGPTQFVEAPIGYGVAVDFDTVYMDVIPGDTYISINNMGTASYTALLTIVGYGLPAAQVTPKQSLNPLTAWFGWEVSNCNLDDTSLTYPYGEYAIQVNREMMLLGILVNHSAAIGNGVATNFWEVLALGGWASYLVGLPFPIPGNNANPVNGPAAPGFGTIQENPSVNSGPSMGTFPGLFYSDILKESSPSASDSSGQHSTINLDKLRIHLMPNDYIWFHAVGQTTPANTSAALDYEAQLVVTYAILD